MSTDRFTPEEFERLLALPEDHPDRRRVEATAEFEAMRRMHDEFERPSDTLLSSDQLEAASRELSRRVAVGGGAVDRPPVASGGEARRASTQRRSFASRVLELLRTPASRAGLALACGVVVVVALWWSEHRGQQPNALRGAREDGAFEVTLILERRDAVELRWARVAAADAYRVVFLGADLGETAHVDVADVTRIELRRSELPAGIAAGTRVSFEVVALRRGVTIATTPARSVLLP
jgi:hypothetical protein